MADEMIATIIITLLIAAMVAAIIVNHFKDKKNGKSSCGAGCSGCAMAGKCHKQ